MCRETYCADAAVIIFHILIPGILKDVGISQQYKIKFIFISILGGSNLESLLFGMFFTLHRNYLIDC